MTEPTTPVAPALPELPAHDPALDYSGSSVKLDGLNVGALATWLERMASACTTIVLDRDFNERPDAPANGWEFSPGQCTFSYDFRGEGHLLFGGTDDYIIPVEHETAPDVLDERLRVIDDWHYSIFGSRVILRRRDNGREYTIYFVELPPAA